MILNEDFLSEGIDNFWIWLDKGSYAVFDVIQRLPTIAIWNLVFLNTNYE